MYSLKCATVWYDNENDNVENKAKLLKIMEY